MPRSILRAALSCAFLFVSVTAAIPGVCAAAPTVQEWGASQSRTIGLLIAHRDEEAETSAKQMVRIAEQLGPLPRNFSLLVESLSLLCNAYDAQNRVSDAIAVRQRTLTLVEQHYGKDSPMVSVPLAVLAGLYVKAGKINEAETAYKRAAAIKEKADPQHSMGALMNLARFYQKTKKYKEAEETYLRLVALYEKQGGEQDARLHQLLTELADLAKAQGHEAQAKDYAARAQKT
jgi:tetratricopeptide (TPR) repeat protein